MELFFDFTFLPGQLSMCLYTSQILVKTCLVRAVCQNIFQCIPNIYDLRFNCYSYSVSVSCILDPAGDDSKGFP